MKTFITLLIGILLGVGIVWFFSQGDNQSRSSEIGEELSEGANKVKEGIQETAEEFSLDTESIKKELKESGQVVREKMEQAGESMAKAASDAKTTTMIKGKLALDDQLSALDISVDSSEGVVTLEGTVASHEHIARAMKLALETDGVKKVISELAVEQTTGSTSKEESGE